MNQYLVDYTVRNIMTGDEEEIRVLELEPDEYTGFPDQVREEIRGLISPYAEAYRTSFIVDHDGWSAAQERVVELLMPYISDPATYAADYMTWERRLMDTGHAVERITEAHPPEDVAAAVRVVCIDAIDAAIENWAEGFWEDWHADITRVEVLDRLMGFIESWTETDSNDEAEAMGWNERLLPAANEEDA